MGAKLQVSAKLGEFLGQCQIWRKFHVNAKLGENFM